MKELTPDMLARFAEENACTVHEAHAVLTAEQRGWVDTCRMTFGFAPRVWAGRDPQDGTMKPLPVWA